MTEPERAGGRAPRVLVSGVVLSQPMGGVRRHNAELLPRVAAILRSRGGDLDVLAPREGLAFALPGVRVLPSRVPSGPPAWRASFESRALARVLREARASGAPYDVVHSAHLPAPVVDAVRAITIHDLRSIELASPRDGGRGAARRALGRSAVARAVRGARVVITVSETVRDSLLRRFELAAEDVLVVPNAADHLQVLSRRPPVDAALLHVGHVEPRKNLRLLVEALALDRELPPLLLAGATRGSAAARLERRARDLRVAARVRFAGPVPDARLPELYASAAAVVLPSRLEGFGIVALEAMRARVPLAVSTAGALPEVTDGLAPTFAPDDPGACARAIRRALAASPAELDAAAARSARFTWDASAERFADALCRAVRAAQPPRRS